MLLLSGESAETIYINGGRGILHDRDASFRVAIAAEEWYFN